MGDFGIGTQIVRQLFSVRCLFSIAKSSLTRNTQESEDGNDEQDEDGAHFEERSKLLSLCNVLEQTKFSNVPMAALYRPACSWASIGTAALRQNWGLESRIRGEQTVTGHLLRKGYVFAFLLVLQAGDRLSSVYVVYFHSFIEHFSIS